MFACIFVQPAAADIGHTIGSDNNSQNEDALLRLAFCFSPRVEVVAPGMVVLDLDGMEPLFGAPEKMAHAIAARFAESASLASPVNIAIAGNVDAAIYAARGFPGITVIPQGEEAAMLRDLSLSHLPASPELPEIEQTWQRWGVRTFGDLAALPEIGVAERLGPSGARLHRIARGAEDRPLIPLITVPAFEASQELEYAVELLEPLAFILASLLNQVCAALEARAKGAAEIWLRLRLQNPAEKTPSDWERILRLPVPMRDTIALLKLIRLDLEAHSPLAPVIAVFLRAEPGEPRATQNHLFLPPAPEPARLELTLARITKLVGGSNAGSPELLDTHRPDAFALRTFRVAALHHYQSRGRNNGRKRDPNRSNVRQSILQPDATSAQRSQPLSFRVFRPPLCAEVECSGGRPTRIWARGVRGNIVRLAGPWRISGEWWTAESWDREEWDVEVCEAGVRIQESAVRRGRTIHSPSTPGGCLYRIYRDLTTSSWHIAGSYD